MPEENVQPPRFSVAEVREFVHDLRNSLYVLRLGLGMLSEIRGDAGRFQDLLSKLQAEEQAAARRLEEFSQAHK